MTRAHRAADEPLVLNNFCDIDVSVPCTNKSQLTLAHLLALTPHKLQVVVVAVVEAAVALLHELPLSAGEAVVASVVPLAPSLSSSWPPSPRTLSDVSPASPSPSLCGAGGSQLCVPAPTAAICKCMRVEERKMYARSFFGSN